MSVTIPKLNGQIKASTTTSPQVSVRAGAQYQDAGLDKVINDIGNMVDTAFEARERFNNGMRNGTMNHISNIFQTEYNNMVGSKNYNGYASKGFQEDFRKSINEKISSVKSNGYTINNLDGTTTEVAALSEEEWNKIAPQINSMLLNYDARIFEFSSRQIAERESNDYKAAVKREALLIASSDDPMTQVNASISLVGLARGFYGKSMSEEAKQELANEQTRTALDTYLANVTATDPVKALEVMVTNPNFGRFGVSTAKARGEAIKAVSEIAGLNDALISNGQNPIPSNINDGHLRKLLTEQEYAEYSIARAMEAEKKISSIAKQVKDNHTTINLALMAELADAGDNPDKIDEINQKIAMASDDPSVGNIVKRVSDVRDYYTKYINDIEEYQEFSDVDGEFSEERAIDLATVLANNRLGITDQSQLTPEVEEARNNLVTEYVSQERGRFYAFKDGIVKQNKNAVTSAKAVNEFFSTLGTANEPTAPTDVPGFSALNIQDQKLITDVLMNRAKTRQKVNAIQKAEGGNFDLTAIAFQQWKALGNKSMLSNFVPGSTSSEDLLLPSDLQKFNSFAERFKELYIRKYDREKPNAQQLFELAIEANNTKTYPYEKYAAFGNRIRLAANSKYDRIPNIWDTKEALDELLSMGWWRRTFTSDDNLFTSDPVDADIYTALHELYQSDSVTEYERDALVDALATGDDSFVARILEAKKAL